MEQTNILEMRDIRKSFSGVRALKGVDFAVRAGEAHALVGENGAGKSTLIKVLTGVYQKDGGTVVFGGREIDPKTPFDAQSLGISPIYQELNLIPDLTVAENIFLGHAPRRHGLIDWKELFRRAEALVGEMGIEVDVRAPISTLGTAIQQMVAIVRAVQLDCRLIVMDEPTSSLDKNEVEALMGIIRALKRKRVAVIFISHRLDEIFAICERVTILKDGEGVGTYETGALTQHEMVSLMLGRAYTQRERSRAARSFDGEAEYLFELEDAVRAPEIASMTIRIHKGEVLGLAGLLGAGRTESAKLFFGYARPERGTIKKEGRTVRVRSTKDAVRLGMAMCPEDRRAEGIIPNMSVRDNITLASLSRLSRFGILPEREKRRLCGAYIEQFSIKTPSGRQLVKNLSGGNQQKVILARWLATDPQMIILDEPTRGIDVGAKGAIEDLIQDFSSQGISVLYISSEIEELARNCDRVLVMREGRQIAELAGGEVTSEGILNAIAGGAERGGTGYGA